MDHFYYTSAEAAERLGLTTATLAVYRTNGTGPKFIKIGGRGRAAIVYRRPDLDEWAQRQKPNSKAYQVYAMRHGLKRSKRGGSLSYAKRLARGERWENLPGVAGKKKREGV